MGRIMVPEQTLYNAVTFRHLLDSMARPGKINQLEYPDFLEDVPLERNANFYALGAMLTLLDREVTFAVAADGQWLSHTSPIVQWLLLRSGSTIAPPKSAMFAFFCQGWSAGLITQLSRGTQLGPESSATAFYCIEQLTDTRLSDDGQISQQESSSGIRAADKLAENLDWVTLELTGPGIESMRSVSVRGLARSEIDQLNLTRQGYPLGIDVYLIDGEGHCIGLPRTTRISVMATRR